MKANLNNNNTDNKTLKIINCLPQILSYKDKTIMKIFKKLLIKCLFLHSNKERTMIIRSVSRFKIMTKMFKIK